MALVDRKIGEGTALLERKEQEPVSTDSNLGLINYSARIIDLYQDMRPALYSYLRSRGLNEATSEDVVQDTFLRLLFHVEKGTFQPNIRAWIFRVAYNLSIDFHRSRSKHALPSDDHVRPTPSEIVDVAPNPE